MGLDIPMAILICIIPAAIVAAEIIYRRKNE